MKLPDDRWEPSPTDKLWTANLLELLRDGGTWCVPESQMVYQVNKKKKTLTVLVDTSTEEGRILHNRIKKICAYLGWSVVEGKKPDKPDCG